MPSNKAKWIATWFGVGLIGRAPGTCGSLAALPLAWVVQHYFYNMGLLLFSLLVFIVGVFACNAYVKQTGKQDPSEAVIDEVAGQCFLLAALPPTLAAYAAGFILFRLFDIFKPYPVNLCDRRIKGGLGVMLDDMVAAAYPIVLFTIACMLGLADMNKLYQWLG